MPRELRDRAGGRGGAPDHEGGASMGRAGRSAFRRTHGMARHPVEPQERARNRQGAGRENGAAEGDDRSDGETEEQVGADIYAAPSREREAGSQISKAGSPPRGRAIYRKPALNRSSVAEPGQSSFSPNELSGASTVARWWCRSSGSLST